jgi:glutamate racemase
VIQRKVGRRVRLIDSADGLARQLEEFLTGPAGEDLNLPRTGHHRFLFSDLTEHLAGIARRLIKGSLSLELARF